MPALKRKKVNKAASAKAFNRSAKKTKAANVKSGPMRGGFRI